MMNLVEKIKATKANLCIKPQPIRTMKFLLFNREEIMLCIMDSQFINHSNKRSSKRNLNKINKNKKSQVLSVFH